MRSWPLVVAGILSIWIFHAWYFNAGTLTFGDWKTVLPASVHDDFPLPHVWLGTYKFGEIYPVFYAFTTAFAWFARLGIDFPISERLLFFWFFPPILLGGGFLFLRSLGLDILGAAVGAVLFLFNASLLTSAAGGHTNATNAIAFGLVTLFAAVQYSKDQVLRWWLLIVIGAAIEATYDVRWSPPTLFLLLVVVCVARPEIRIIVRNVIAGFVGFTTGVVIANLYWLLPRAMGFPISVAPPNGNTDISWVFSSSVTTFTDALALWDPYFLNKYDHPPLVFQHVSVAFLAAILVVVAVSLFFAYRMRLAWVGLALYFFGAFLVKGAGEPFGGVYVWAFVNIPIFNAYRDPSKFAVVSTIGLALLVACGVSSAYRRRPWVGHAFATLAVVVAIGGVAHIFDRDMGGVLVSRPFPSQFVTINADLAGDRTWGRVLWLPEVPRWAAWTRLHPAIDGTDVGRSEFLNFTPGAGDDRLILGYVSSPLFPWLARQSGIRYIVVATNYYDDATIAGLGDSLQGLVAAVRSLPQFEELPEIGDLHVFRARYGAPHVMSSSAATLATGSISALQSAALFPAVLAAPPVVFAQDLPIAADADGWQRAFDRLLRLDFLGEQPLSGDGLPHGAQSAMWSSPVRIRPTDRIVGAPSTWAGSEFGDAVISANGPGPGRYDVAFSPGAATIRGERVLYDRLISTMPAGPIVGRVLQSGGLQAVGFVDSRNEPIVLRNISPGMHQLQVENVLPSRVRLTIRGDCTGGITWFFAGRATTSMRTLTASMDVPSGRSAIALLADGSCENIAVSMVGLPSPVAPNLNVVAAVLDRPMPLWRQPSIVVDSQTTDRRQGRSLIILGLSDASGNRYVVPASSLAVQDVGSGPLLIDPRRATFEAATADDTLGQPLARSDGFDNLLLTAIDIVRMPHAGTSGKFSARIRVTTANGGLAADGIIPLPASRYTVRRGVVSPDNGGALVTFATDTALPTDRMIGQVVDLQVDAETYRAASGGYLSASDSRAHLDGATTSVRGLLLWSTAESVGFQPVDGNAMALGRSAILSIIPTASVSVELVSSPLRDGTIIADVASGDPGMSVWSDSTLSYDGVTRHVLRSLEEHVPPGYGTTARVRCDVGDEIARAGGFGADAKLLSYRVLVIANSNQTQSSNFTISDGYLFRDGSSGGDRLPVVHVGRAILAPGQSQVSAGDVSSTLGSRSAIVAVDFRSAPPAVRGDTFVAIDDEAVGYSKFEVRGNPHWIVFADRFDPLWSLDGLQAAGAIHMIGNGFLNAWYSPRGFADGTYTATFLGDALTQRSALLGFALFAGVVMLFIWSFRASMMRPT